MKQKKLYWQPSPRQAAMSDRELLELAAKAAGLEITEKMADFYARKRKEDRFELWNPLTDDGDALRLAVKLGLQVEIDGHNKREFVVVRTSEYNPIEIRQTKNLGAEQATRRAIVRAAAEIGRAMP